TVFEEVSGHCYGGLSFAEVGERAGLPARPENVQPLPNPPAARLADGPGLRLVTYRPLFSGPAVERTPELQFQRPAGEIELAPDDARERGIASGDKVRVSSNGTSVALRARIARDLAPGVARVPRNDAQGLHDLVEVRK